MIEDDVALRRIKIRCSEVRQIMRECIETLQSKMHSGAIKLMSDHEFAWFVLLICVIGGIGSGVILKLMRECTMSTIEIQKRAQEHANEGTETQGLMFDREYSGRIYLPSGC